MHLWHYSSRARPGLRRWDLGLASREPNATALVGRLRGLSIRFARRGNDRRHGQATDQTVRTVRRSFPEAKRELSRLGASYESSEKPYGLP